MYKKLIFKHSGRRSGGTVFVPLCFALTVAYRYGFTKNILSNMYDLNRQTLAAIERGNIPARGAAGKYMNELVVALNDLRLKALEAGYAELAGELSGDLRDIALVMCGIATDAELEEREHKKHREEILKELLLHT